MVNKFTNIKDRVVQIAEKQKISKERFFRSIGMTSANFRGKAKATPLNSNAIARIIVTYPEVDLYWLLLGEEKPSSESLVNEPPIEYHTINNASDEKDEIIAMLKQQIKDLKADKENLMRLLEQVQGKK